MLTGNNDVDLDILLNLDWEDLQQFCSINNYIHQYCINNNALQHKIDTINKQVDFCIDTLQDNTSVKVHLVNNPTFFPDILNYMEKYHMMDLSTLSRHYYETTITRLTLVFSLKAKKTDF